MITKPEILLPPFVYFGSKSRIASLAWSLLGDVPTYIEPFAGSLAVYLARPHPHKLAVINDKDGLIVNFWRAIQREPEEVAKWAAWPIAESELHARHIWIKERLGKDYGDHSEFAARLEANPDFYDARLAGYWVYGMACSISGSWCINEGAWGVKDGMLVPQEKTSEMGIYRQRPAISNKGFLRKDIEKEYAPTGEEIRFYQNKTEAIHRYFVDIANKLANAIILCGDWTRALTPAIMFRNDKSGIFLDPPYDRKLRNGKLYNVDEDGLSAKVRQWCLEHGDDPRLRILLCGYEGEGHEVLEQAGWKVIAWKGGSAGSLNSTNTTINRFKERIWVSPHCIGVKTLF